MLNTTHQRWGRVQPVNTSSHARPALPQRQVAAHVSNSKDFSDSQPTTSGRYLEKHWNPATRVWATRTVESRSDACGRSRVSACAQSRKAQSTLSSSILSVVKDEQKYAAESYRKDPELLDGPPNDFELEDVRGSRCLCLMKEHKGEQIVIDLELGDEDDDLEGLSDDEGDDDEDDEEDLPDVTFRVSISKSSGVLVFHCTSNGQYVTINELLLDDQQEDGEDSDGPEPGDAYLGPPFSDLDDTLQQAFLDYLEERGITGDLGRYLQRLYEDKCSVEYVAWLQRVNEFIAS